MATAPRLALPPGTAAAPRAAVVNGDLRPVIHLGINFRERAALIQRDRHGDRIGLGGAAALPSQEGAPVPSEGLLLGVGLGAHLAPSGQGRLAARPFERLDTRSRANEPKG